MKRPADHVDVRPQIEHATDQIRQMLLEGPELALYLLRQQPGATPDELAAYLGQFFDELALRATGPTADALCELLPWADCHTLAVWLIQQAEQHHQRLIEQQRTAIARAYVTLAASRNGEAAFRHGHTCLTLSPELVALAIGHHIEAALLEHKGPERGPQACWEFLGAMLTPDMADLSPLGVTVMDELFTSLVNDFEQTGLAGLPATH